MNRGRTGVSLKKARQTALQKMWISMPGQAASRKVMATPPITSIGSGSTISSPAYHPLVSTSSSPDLSLINNSFVSFCKCGNLSTLLSYLYSNTVTYDAAPTYLRSTLGMSFMFDGQYLEFVVYNGNHSIKVDDEYISLTPQEATGLQTYHIDFGSRKLRRIDYVMDDNAYINGFFTGANDSISPAEIRGPKTVVMGDSFFATAVTGRSINGIPIIMGDMLGWDDVISTGNSATGILTKDSRTNFRDRVQHDVISLNPEIVVICGSINDVIGLHTKAQMLAECRLLFKEITESLPDSILIATSPTWYSGISTLQALAVEHRDAIKQAVEEYNGLFIDWIELPIGRSEVITTGVISADITAGDNSFTSTTFLGDKNTVQIGTDRVLITSKSGSDPFTYAVNGVFLNNHTAGDAVTTIGGSLLTGVGHVGGLTGFGNCDIWIGSDSIHPTIIGNEGFARFIASNIIDKL